MNGADEVLYSRGISHVGEGTGNFGFAISQIVGPIFFGSMSDDTLIVLERIGWWGHIVMVFGFLNYLPYSKHFHILLAFPTTWYSNLENKITGYCFYNKFRNNTNYPKLKKQVLM